jgi:hypothetical protein
MRIRHRPFPRVWPRRDTRPRASSARRRNSKRRKAAGGGPAVARRLLYLSATTLRSRTEDIMRPHAIRNRLIAGTLLATFAVSALAPAAHAGRGPGESIKFRRWERPVDGGRGSHGSRFEFRHHDAHRGGSTFGSFIGGLAVGAILTSIADSHAASHQAVEPAPAPCPRSYGVPTYEPPPVYCPPRHDESRDTFSYEDPYCRERFGSLATYLAHVDRNGGHPPVVQVIDDQDGQCVDVIHFDGHAWQSVDRGTFGEDPGGE